LSLDSPILSERGVEVKVLKKMLITLINKIKAVRTLADIIFSQPVKLKISPNIKKRMAKLPM